MYNSTWEGGLRVYSYNGDELEIDGEWLMMKIENHFGWEVISYANNIDYLDLYGSYSMGKIIEIKKFIYDTYPCVGMVEPRLNSIRIHFKTKINFIYNSLITDYLN